MSYIKSPLTGSTAKTVTGVGTVASLGSASQVSVFVDVTAVAGVTPTLNLSVAWSLDGVNFSAGETPVAFASITTAKRTHLQVASRAPFCRLAWTIGGTTPSFTFSADAAYNN